MSQKVVVSASVLSALQQLVPFLRIQQIDIKAASFRLLSEKPAYRFFEVSILTSRQNGETVPSSAQKVYAGLELYPSGIWHLKTVHVGLQDEEGFDLENGIDPHNKKGGRNLLRDLDELEGIALKSIADTCPEILRRTDFRSVAICPMFAGKDDLTYLVVLKVRDPGKQNVGQSFVQVLIGEDLDPLSVCFQGEEEFLFNKHADGWTKKLYRVGALPN